MNLWNPFAPTPPAEQPSAMPELDPGPNEDELRPGPAPAALPVHVLAGDALVRCGEGRLIIERPDEETIERPLSFVSALHVHGWATVTAPCIRDLLGQGTPVVWRSPGGYPVGYSAPLDRAGLTARRMQYKAAQSGSGSKPTGLQIACEFVAAKIDNTRELVRRRELPNREQLRRSLKMSARKALRARNLDELRGYEGSAAALYYSVFDDMIGAQAGDLSFENRSKRPPRNALNAMLSYAYAVLAGECLCAVAAAGLDPRLGFLHSERAGRPALALDIMEPFRPLVAEASVLAGLNRGQFAQDGFSSGEGGRVLMSGHNRKILIGLLEQRLDR